MDGQQLTLWQVTDPALAEPAEPEETLATAQAKLRARLDDGTNCPLCGKHCQRYRRKLNATMTRALIWLCRTALEDELGDWGTDPLWVNVPSVAPDWLLRTNQLPTLRLWKLVERKPHDPEDTSKKTSGIWRPTALGIRFARGKTTVPAAVYEYGGKVDAYTETHTTVQDALGKRFDYGELMGWCSA